MTNRAGCLFVWIACVLLSFCGQCWGASSDLVVANSHDVSPVPAAQLGIMQPRTALWQSLITLPDLSGRLTPQTAAKEFDAGHGERLPNADYAYSTGTPYPYWARISLKNTSDQTQSWLLSYELPTQDATDLWKAEGADWQTYAALDEHQSSFGDGQLFPVWRVRLSAGETQTFLLRLDGYNRMRFPLFAMQDDAFAKQQRKLFLWLGIVMTVPLVVLLYVLTLIRITEDKSLPILSRWR
jgi:7TMR-DISM extracellular 2